jgi:hypothetical protein
MRLRKEPFVARLGPPGWKVQSLVLQFRGGRGFLLGMGAWSMRFEVLALYLVAVMNFGEALDFVLGVDDLIILRVGERVCGLQEFHARFGILIMNLCFRSLLFGMTVRLFGAIMLVRARCTCPVLKN